MTDSQDNIAAEDEVRVVIVDDHAFFREGLAGLLKESGLDVVKQASNGHEALEVVPEAAPDVVVMDLHMPGMGGVEATRRLSELVPISKVVVLTISDDERDVMDAIAAGASGYLLKNAPVEQLVAGIRAAADGESLISPRIAAGLLERLRPPGDESSDGGRLRPLLSERELEVLKLLVEGKENTQIAEQLFISPKTVKNHISSILAKLHVDNRIQAAVYAVQNELI